MARKLCKRRRMGSKSANFHCMHYGWWALRGLVERKARWGRGGRRLTFVANQADKCPIFFCYSVERAEFTRLGHCKLWDVVIGAAQANNARRYFIIFFVMPLSRLFPTLFLTHSSLILFIKTNETYIFCKKMLAFSAIHTYLCCLKHAFPLC